MSHDGSSCKSYIKHPTEKERLDNLAFTSFPEDYLPYASSYHHGGRGSGKAPPYLVWDERQPRKSRSRRRSCCSTAALVTAITLIVAAILVVVAISVYLGVVTNLFRSPVLSLSGKFRVSEGDEFSDELLNSTSYQFLYKAETYQAMVENVFLSSSLEPAFIAARIHSFRPGMLVFFRVYLDRRKLKQDDSSTMQLVKNLVRSDAPAFGALTIDQDSVDIDENEEWVSVPIKLEHRTRKTSQTAPPPATKRLPTRMPHPKLATAPSNKVTPLTRRISRPPNTSPAPRATPASRTPEPDRNRSRTGTGEAVPVAVINSEDDPFRFNYGQWKPVPIEDSVSPSFRDQRTPPGRGSSRHLDELPNPTNRLPPSNGAGVVPSRPPPGVGLVNKPSRLTPVGTGLVNQPNRPFTNVGVVNQPVQPSSSVGEVKPFNNPSASNPLHVGVGSVSVLEDAFSHVDPAPIPIRKNRPLRPLVVDSPQTGDVASSIMSSVSLVVNPSQKNRTASLDKTKLEMAKPVKVENEHPYRHPIHDQNTDRNDHASYRFLDDEKDVADSKQPTEALEWESSNSSDTTVETSSDEISLETLSTTSGPSIVLRNESTVEYLEFVTDTISTTEVTNERGLLTRDDSSSFTMLPNDENNSTVIITDSQEMGLHFEESNNNEDNSSYLSNYREESDISSANSRESTTVLLIEDNTTHLYSTEPKVEASNEFKDISSSPGFTTNDNTNTKEFENDKEATTMINSSTRDEMSSTPSTDKLNSDSKTSTVIDYESELNESNPELDSLKDQLTTLNSPPITKETSEKLLPESMNIHSQEGHGFYVPLLFKKQSSVEYSEIGPVRLKETTIFTESTTNYSTISTVNEIGESTISPDRSGISNTSYAESFSDPESSTALTSEMETLADMNTESTTDIPTRTTTSPLNSNMQPEIVSSTTGSEVHTTSITEQTSAEATSSSSTSIETGTETDEVSTPRMNVLASNDSEIASFGASNDSDIISGKIVPQLSDLSINPNDIESDDKNFIRQDDDLDTLDNIPTNGDGLKDGEVIRHITTVPPTVPSFAVSLGKHPVFISDTCPDDEMKCGSGECVDVNSRCNMKRDCRDNSDEKGCPCADLLKIMGQSQKICDGVEDCLDHSDEQNCSWCEEGQVVCSQTKFCINSSQVCDGHNDCPLGTDERYCVKLAESISDAEGVHYRSNGYLMVRKQGKWGKLCLDNLQNSEVLRTKLDDLGQAVCSALTYKNLSESSRILDPDDSHDSYYAISNEVSSQSKRSSAIFQPSTCQSKAVMSVKCGSLACGLRPMATSNRRRIVGGSSAASGSWPWQVALYKEGDFQCGAVLVSDTWLVSAGHCFYSTQTAYWIARLGLLRRGSELPSPAEQIRRIQQIILHPDYVDKGFINDVAMLKMDRPVLFSDYLRPVCLPLENEDAALWHGKQCSVVGWGKLYEIGHTFPDSLQEVRLPVIATEECRKKIIFLTMYHITDNMFCAGYERGGRDACLGDSGGPLMCQREDGRWLLLGVTSNGDGCGRPGRPGVYTKVAQYLGWIKQIMETEPIIQNSADTCEGVRCNLGRCIPSYKICDTRWDCSEGVDEDGCED